MFHHGFHQARLCVQALHHRSLQHRSLLVVARDVRLDFFQRPVFDLAILLREDPVVLLGMEGPPFLVVAHPVPAPLGMAIIDEERAFWLDIRRILT